MKKCVVNVFSKGREEYEEQSYRLVKNLKRVGFDGDILLFSPLITQNRVEENLYYYSGWPTSEKYGSSLPHKEAPHQFKSYAIQRAKELGYTQVMWCDSSVRVVKNPQKFFDLTNELGIVTFDAEYGAWEHLYTSERCLEILDCSVEFAKTFNQCTAGVVLFDFSNKRGEKIHEEYLKYCSIKEAMDMTLGSSVNGFIEHRSDQSIISFLIKKYKMNNLSWGSYIFHHTLSHNNQFDLSPTFISGGKE